MTISTLPLMIEGLHIATPDGRLLLENGGFEMAAGELVLLIGPSGCGKSTLINALSGLLGDDGARWDLRGQLVLNGQYYDLACERCDVGGLVFQGNALFDDLSAAQNLAIAIDHAGAPDPGLPTLLAALLQDVDPHRRVSSLSGGQRQRVAIARTVLAKRPILLFDEPNSGLDTHAAQRLGELIKELCREMKIPALVVAHHFDDLVLLADKVLVFDPVQRALHQAPPDVSASNAPCTGLVSRWMNRKRPRKRRFMKSRSLPGNHACITDRRSAGFCIICCNTFGC